MKNYGLKPHVMKIVASLLLLLGIVYFLPLPENSSVMDGLDAAQVRLGLGLFACIAFLWMTEALPLSITALLVPVLAAAMGLGGLKGNLASFANPLIFVFFGGFALASALSAQGLDRWLAIQLGRMGKGKFLAVSIWLFVGTAVLSMWMSNTATAAMMLPLALGILNQFRVGKAHSGNTCFLLLGLAYSASIGGLGTIVGSPPNGIAAKQLGISFSEWMAFGVPAVAVLLPAMIVLLWLLLKPENLTVDSPDVEEPKFSFTKMRWITLGIFGFAALAWMFGGRLGPMLGIDDMDAWVALVAAIALVVCKVVGWKEIQEGTDWGVLFLFGGGLALSSVLGSSGASLFMARLLGATLEAWPLWAIIAAIVCFVIFLTELSSNTASAALLVPIFFTMAIELELPATQLILPLALAASCAFMLPVGTPPNAIVFGSGRIPQRTMMKTGIWLNLIFIALITALSLLLF
jgi:sodium-dependent dicarboxylate transporter 2/3/5